MSLCGNSPCYYTMWSQKVNVFFSWLYEHIRDHKTTNTASYYVSLSVLMCIFKPDRLVWHLALWKTAWKWVNAWVLCPLMFLMHHSAYWLFTASHAVVVLLQMVSNVFLYLTWPTCSVSHSLKLWIPVHLYTWTPVLPVNSKYNLHQWLKKSCTLINEVVSDKLLLLTRNRNAAIKGFELFKINVIWTGCIRCTVLCIANPISQENVKGAV